MSCIWYQIAINWLRALTSIDQNCFFSVFPCSVCFIHTGLFHPDLQTKFLGIWSVTSFYFYSITSFWGCDFHHSLHYSQLVVEKAQKMQEQKNINKNNIIDLVIYVDATIIVSLFGEILELGNSIFAQTQQRQLIFITNHVKQFSEICVFTFFPTVRWEDRYQFHVFVTRTELDPGCS